MQAESSGQFQCILHVADFGYSILPGHVFEDQTDEFIIVAGEDVDRVGEVVEVLVHVDGYLYFGRCILFVFLRTLLDQSLNLALR